MIVGVDRLLGAHCAAEDLNGAVGDDFVGVHVGLGARAGLPDNEGEVVDELERGHLFGCLLDGLSKLGICGRVSSALQARARSTGRTQPKLHVDRGGSALEDTKSPHNGRRHAVLGLVDAEVLEGALRLGAPVLVCGHLDLAKGIALCSGVGHDGSGGTELAALEGSLMLGERGSGGRERPCNAGTAEGGVADLRMCQ